MILEASISRDWTTAYCQYARRMWIEAFEAKYGWALTDIVLAWDGRRIRFYRDPREYVDGLIALVEKRLEEDSSFIEKLAAICTRPAR